MSTKYPTALDDGVTLGPTFIDVAPPADPQRNIAAEFRNNERDAIVAVQTRVGITDDPSTSSVDWGMLSVSGSPNQGLRFAGDHAAWPGLVAEDGIFIDSGTGNVSFHKSGDATGVFTDLTSGGIGNWDALYTASKTMDIGAGNPLTWTQSSGVGVGFLVQKTSNTANDAIMKVHATNASFPAGVPALSVVNDRSTSPLAIDVSGEMRFGANGRIYTGGTNNLTLQTEGAGASVNLISSDGDINLTANTNANSDVNVLVKNDFTVDAQGGAASTITLNTYTFNVNANTACAIATTTGPNTYASPNGHTFTSSVGTGVDSFTDASFTVNASQTISLNGQAGITLGGVLSPANNITISCDKSDCDLFLEARASGLIPFNTAVDTTLATTKQSIIGAINEVNTAALTVPTWDAIYAADKILDITGLSFELQNTQTIASNPSFTVSRNNTSTGNSMVDFSDITATSSHSTLIVGNGGTTGTAVASIALGIHTGAIDICQSGYWAFGPITTATINMYTASFLPNAGDTAGATYRGFYALGSAGGSAVKHGFVSDALWDYGLYLLSPAYISAPSAAAGPVLELDQKDTNEAFINFVGQESANQTDSISNVAGDGPAVVGPLAKVGTSGWVFSKMVQVEINGNIEWIATYDVAP